VPLNLPKVEFKATTTKPENVNLSIRVRGGECEVYWELTRVNSEDLLDRGRWQPQGRDRAQESVFGKVDELPEVHIRGDVNTPYRCIGGAVFTCSAPASPGSASSRNRTPRACSKRARTQTDRSQDMGAAVASDSDEPMMDINTTPLIDVMLVLLIMFIITIPIQTHAVKIDLPVMTPTARRRRSIRSGTRS
jgi:hypothetical protein